MECIVPTHQRAAVARNVDFIDEATHTHTHTHTRARARTHAHAHTHRGIYVCVCVLYIYIYVCVCTEYLHNSFYFDTVWSTAFLENLLGPCIQNTVSNCLQASYVCNFREEISNTKKLCSNVKWKHYSG